MRSNISLTGLCIEYPIIWCFMVNLAVLCRDCILLQDVVSKCLMYSVQTHHQQKGVQAEPPFISNYHLIVQYLSGILTVG